MELFLCQMVEGQQLAEVEFHLVAGIGAWLFLLLCHDNSKVTNSDSSKRSMDLKQRLVETVR